MSLEEGIYTITNVKSGTALDLSGGDNRSIIGFDFHGQGNQQVSNSLNQDDRRLQTSYRNFILQWSIQKKDCGYTIRGLSTGKFLSYEGSNLRDAVKVIAADGEKIWEIYADNKNPSAYRYVAFVSCTAHIADS